MNEKKTFEMPSITTYQRDELIVETALTQIISRSTQQT
jgi:hypothetical protein